MHMNTMQRTVLGMGAALVLAVAAQAADKKPDLGKLPAAAAKAGLTFDKDVKPILEKSCFKCHSGDKPKGKYVIDNLAGAVKGGEAGAAVKPGKSAESPLLLFAADAVEEMEMPPTDKRDKFPALTKEQLALVRAWIDQGAK